MNDDNGTRSPDTGTGSRRSFLRKGAFASGALALGLSRSGDVAAQDSGGKALMFNDEYHPGARFRVISPVIEETPDIEAVEEKSVWSDTNTRVIEYLNTNERALLFPTDAAHVRQGAIYQFSPHDLSVYDDDEGIISVGFEAPDEDGDDEETDYEVIERGGKALVHTNNFFPGALFRFVSGVVEWAPREAVRNSDVFSEYNTRFGEYLNASDEFFIYPAHAARVDRGAVYVIRDEYDITEPEGLLVTVDFDRVDEETINEG